jgi:Bacterial PH domain
MAANQSSGGPPGTGGGSSPGARLSAMSRRGHPRPGDSQAKGSGQPQTFRSPTALVVWVVWLLFAVANWIDLAVQGRDRPSVQAAAILLLVTGVIYATAQRPRVIADDAGLTVRNPLRDYGVGWASVSKVDLTDLLRVHTDQGPGGTGQRSKIINVWAVHYSRRRQFTAEARARRAARPRRSGFGLSYGGSRGLPGVGPAAADTSTPESEAEKVVRLLSQRATAARAETVWATGTVPIAGQPTPADASPADASPADPASALGTASPDVTASPDSTASPAGTASPADLTRTGWLEPLTSTWSWPAIAAIVIPALILLVVYLV